MPRPVLLSRRVFLRLTDEMALAVDHWRGRLPGVPSRGEAIRRLIAIALKEQAEK
jgi:hypothetical protein